MAMTPLEIAASLGVSLAEIGSSRDYWTRLAAAGSIASSALPGISMYNAFRKAWTSLPGAVPSIPVNLAYRLAQFWTSPDYYTAQLPPQSAIPLQFTPYATASMREQAMGADYRYTVKFTVYFRSGEHQTMGVTVPSSGAMTPTEIREEAYNTLLMNLRGARHAREYDDVEDEEFAPIYQGFEAFQLT